MSEIDSKYTCYVDGKWTNVLPLDDLVRGIKAHIKSVELRNTYLEEENKKLKDEHFKDKSIAKMSQELKKATDDLYRRFPISEKEMESINIWKKKHEIEKHGLVTEKMRMKSQGCCGGKYTFEFIPTSIGTVGRVKCSCGDSFTFQDL